IGIRGTPDVHRALGRAFMDDCRQPERQPAGRLAFCGRSDERLRVGGWQRRQLADRAARALNVAAPRGYGSAPETYRYTRTQSMTIRCGKTVEPSGGPGQS